MLEGPSPEAVEAAPGAQIGLLNKIIRFVHRAKHPVTMQFDLAAERFGKPFKRLVCMLRSLLVMGWLWRFHCDSLYLRPFQGPYHWVTASSPFPETMNTSPSERSEFRSNSMTAVATLHAVGGEAMP